jgi:DNA-binding HxlR family transcriptional regulator
LLCALQRPQFNIRGLRRADLTAFVPSLSPAALSRQLNRMRRLGLFKRVASAYRYYLTRLGRAAIAAACSITEMHLIPVLAGGC